MDLVDYSPEVFAALDVLRRLGATLVDVELKTDELEHAELDVLLCELKADMASYLTTRGAALGTLEDIVRFNASHASAELALFGQDLEGFPDIAEIDHPPGSRGKNVCREYLQRGIAGLDRFRELAGEFGGRLGVQHDVVGPVARALAHEVLVAHLDRLEC